MTSSSLRFALCFTSFLILFGSASFAESGRGKKDKFSYEVNLDTSFVPDGDMKVGDSKIGELSEFTGHTGIVQSSPLGGGHILRLGIDWQAFSFGTPSNSKLPNFLQSVNGVIGADIDLADSWLMRVEAYPGIYSDWKDVNLDDFDMPLILGFTYLMDDKLQLFFGLSVDAKRDLPVLPGAGLRWNFADQWTLMAVFPKPRLQYDYDKNLTFYVGGEFKGGTFQIADDFGSTHGQPNMNNTSVDYTEGRMGVGATLRIHPVVFIEAEAGGVVYREFNFHEAHLRIRSDEVVPYLQLSVNSNF